MKSYKKLGLLLIIASIVTTCSMAKKCSKRKKYTPSTTQQCSGPHCTKQNPPAPAEQPVNTTFPVIDGTQKYSQSGIVHEFSGTAQDFQNIINSDALVLVDFSASWCGPCKTLHPILVKSAQSNSSLIIIKIDIDQHPGLAQQYGIRGMPTLIVFKQGREIRRIVGLDKVNSPKKLLDWVLG